MNVRPKIKLQSQDTLGDASSSADLAFLSWPSYVRWSHIAFLLYGIAAGISIAASQILVVTTIAYWLLVALRSGSILSHHSLHLSKRVAQLGSAAALWVLVAAIACFVGLDTFKAVPELLKTMLYMLLPFCVFSSLASNLISPAESLRRVSLYLFCMFVGFIIASINTVLSSAVGFRIPPSLPGEMTESGQLVLVIPAIVGLLFAYFSGKRIADESRRRPLLIGTLFFLLLLLVAWPQLISTVMPPGTAMLVQIVAGLFAAGIFAFIVLGVGGGSAWRFSNAETNGLATAAIAALFFAALVINLKRGPLLAVLIELGLIGALYSRRLLSGTISASVLLLLFLEPIRHRLATVSDDFLIHGGRSAMWLLGLEMAGRYPLGVGLDNAWYMQQFDPTLPEVHRHMHSNFINIAVECGFLGLAAFLWWMFRAIAPGFSVWRLLRQSTDPLHRRAAALAALLGIALIGWQIAGLVEYNFGDGEVRLVAFFFIGVLLALTRFEPEAKD